jgi:hypothetical protein
MTIEEEGSDVHCRKGKRFGLICDLFVILLAPDVNPTDVHGVGTEHNNLVISWKVRYAPSQV